MKPTYKKVIIYRSQTYDKKGNIEYHYYADKEFAKEQCDTFKLEPICIRVPIDTEQIILNTTKNNS